MADLKKNKAFIMDNPTIGAMYKSINVESTNGIKIFDHSCGGE